jgi:hypothetical protein
LANRLLDALALNSNITEFEVYESLHPSPQSFAHLLTNAPFLRTLKVNVEAFVDRSANDLAVLGAAFGQNRTLQELHLISAQSGHNGMGEIILMHLGSHANHLHKLRLLLGRGATRGQFRALATLIRSTQTLSHLEMCDYIFGFESMGIIWAALQSSNTVHTLSFVYCRMEKDPFVVWTRFLKLDRSKISSLHFRPHLF